jgi:hypothetical protein
MIVSRIARNSSNVVCPVIDVISDDTLEYQGKNDNTILNYYFANIFVLNIVYNNFLNVFLTFTCHEMVVEMSQ